MLFSTVIASASQEYPLYQPENGWAEQKPEDWRDAVLKTIKEVVSQSGVDKDAVKGIGISGQMHGLVMLDEAGEVIRPSIIWCDQRTGAEVEDMLKIMPKEEWIRITANPAGLQQRSSGYVKMSRKIITAAVISYCLRITSATYLPVYLQLKFLMQAVCSF